MSVKKTNKIDWPKRIEDVVIVTFREELDLLKLQLRSLDAFLEKCNLHIVINETNIKDINSEIKKIKVRSKHNIRVWSRESILGTNRDWDSIPGWTSQQLLKLLIPLRRDWIVFDTKDILVRPCSLTDLDRKQRKDYESLAKQDPQAIFYNGVVDMCNKRGLTKKVNPKHINMNHTPRVIVNEIIKTTLKLFKNREEFIDWFLSFDVQGEFILHDYVALAIMYPQKLRFDLGHNAGIWNDVLFKKHPFDSLPDTLRVYKCHRRVYEIPENKEKVDKWLTNVIKSYIKYTKALKGE